MFDCHRPDLIKWVEDHSVMIEEGRPGKASDPEMIEWCWENVGEERPHPMIEAREGWMDYIEGDWAFDGHTFWFSRKLDMMQFMMKFL